jgi:hypothetical protein
MRRLLSTAALCWAVLLATLPGRAAPADAPLAVVRLPAHGASATVIATGPGRSLLLGCAHAFEGNSRARQIVVDVPASTEDFPRRVRITLLAIDERADLSLLQIDVGLLPHVAPVAPAGFVPGHNLLSVGYDGMRLPATRDPVTLLFSTATTTFTRQRPGHGRSGGALLDLDSGYLIGVVQGYEIEGQRRGLYVSHAAILRFLARQRIGSDPSSPVCPNCPR